jgi:hypothetical protein
MNESGYSGVDFILSVAGKGTAFVLALGQATSDGGEYKDDGYREQSQ